ncbi:MAG: hypothetical protein CMP11_05095 [Zetaproteobacteria bacterium]|nr:hypothetical protein [Pseudobdellovibrionaceae bacterium]
MIFKTKAAKLFYTLSLIDITEKETSLFFYKELFYDFLLGEYFFLFCFESKVFNTKQSLYPLNKKPSSLKDSRAYLRVYK